MPKPINLLTYSSEEDIREFLEREDEDVQFAPDQYTLALRASGEVGMRQRLLESLRGFDELRWFVLDVPDAVDRRLVFEFLCENFDSSIIFEADMQEAKHE